MKAIVYRRYGSPDVLEIVEVAKPTPRDNQILIKTHATTVSAGDWRMRTLEMPSGFGLIGRLVIGITGPRQPILGTELAGEVAAVGNQVTKFKAGDQVFAFTGASMGSYVEYKCLREDAAVALKPSRLNYNEAASLPSGGTTALHFFRKGKLQRGERVLIIGASGGVGTAAVQIAKHFGAHVTGVCSTANVELVRSLGADHVIDYKQEDVLQRADTYDVIVDTAGTAPYPRSKRLLTERGRLLVVLGGLRDILQVPWVAMTSRHSVVAGPASGRAEDLRFLADLAQSGVYKPVIDRSYPYTQIVEAHRYVDTGRKRGNVVITF